MSKHVLTDWEDDIEELSILLLLSSLEDYRLAYELNKAFGYSFTSCLSDITKTNNKANYSFRSFYTYDSNNNSCIYLFENQSYSSNMMVSSGGLFGTESHLIDYLMPKYNKWPYILVSEEINSLSSFANAKANSAITTRQLVDFKKIKSTEQNTFTHYYYENQR